MKILLTGFTGVQAHASVGQLELISNLASLVYAMEDLGHEVEWRPAIPGEDLDMFDKVIVSVNGVASWVAPFALGGLYCIGKRQDAIITYDDWQGVKAFGSGNPEKEQAVVWNPKLGRLNHEEAFNDPTTKLYIDEAVEELCYIHRRKTLLPLFRYGDIEKLKLGAPNALRYDPSPYMDIYEYADMDKQRTWVYAGLSDKASWFKRQSFAWEVEKYGVRKLGQPRVKEAMLANIYSERWGVLSPPHDHEGSGWFRVRFLMAASARAIIHCSAAEAASVGYTWRSVHDVEKMSEANLWEVAEEQRLTFQAHRWSKEDLQKFMAEQLA